MGGGGRTPQSVPCCVVLSVSRATIADPEGPSPRSRQQFSLYVPGKGAPISQGTHLFGPKKYQYSVESICLLRWGTSHKVPLLGEELQAINGCRERENQSFPEMSSLEGSPIPHPSLNRRSRLHFCMCVCVCAYVHNNYN